MYKKGNIITVINEENKNYGKEFKVIIELVSEEE